MSSDNPPIVIDDDDELNDPLGGRSTRSIAAPVGAVAARGFYWLSALSIATKFIGMGTQIVLSWFVGPIEFGLVGTSLTISSFIWLVQDAGLAQILIKRQRRFALWCTPVFWFSMALGLISAGLTASSGFIAAHFLHEPALIGLMLILALRGFFSAPSSVPVAQLNMNLKFGLLAGIGLVLVSLERGLMVLFTSPIFRWGAYGFIVAMTIVSGVRTAIAWWYARSPVKMELQLHRWKFIYRDSWLLTLALAFQTVTVYGDNLLLAIFRPAEVVGNYYWAYNLSLQTTMLLTSNLGGVLFPALSKLQKEPERMRQGFIRAARMLTMIGVPGCLLQAAVARPVVFIVFGSKWLPAVPPLQVLSLGMAFGLVNYPAISLLRAQGRFATERTLSGVCAGLFLVAAFLGAWLGGALSMAIAVAIYNAIAGVLFVRSGIGKDWRRIMMIFIPPVICATLAIGTMYLLATHFNDKSRTGCLQQIGLIMVGAGIIYTILVRIFMPDIWAEAIQHARPIWNRVRRMLGIKVTSGA